MRNPIPTISRNGFTIAVLAAITFLIPISSHAQRQRRNPVSTPTSVAEPKVKQVEAGLDTSTTVKQPINAADPAETRPRLRSVKTPNFHDEVAEAETQYVIYRSGNNVPLPLTLGTPLRLSLDAGISTKAMKEGVIVTRLLAIRTPLQTPFQGTYASKDYLVLTEFSGQKSGFKDRSYLMVNPRQFQVEVGPSEYLVIGQQDGIYIALKPGKWRFDLSCSLKQVVTPRGDTWTAPSNSESYAIKGERFGRENKDESYDDYSGFAYFPHGEIVFGVAQLKGLWRYLIHRPNIVLPTETDLYFQVDRITATYIGPSLPTGPAAVIPKQQATNKEP